MANPIKYSTTQVANTIKKGNSVLGVGNNGFGASSETGFWAGVDPPNGGYTVYVNTSGTSGPRIYIADDNSLPSLVNQIGASGITSLSGALGWIDSQSNIICVNREYEGIVTNGLVLNLDAGFIPSYPRSGTVWRDISGNGNNGTLTNGPTFNSGNGGSIVFDGVDDYALTNTNLTLSIATLSCWIKRNGTADPYDGILFSRAPTATGLNFYSSNQLGYHWNDTITTWNWPSGLTIPDNNWCMIAVTITSTAGIVYLGQSSGFTSATNTTTHNTVSSLVFNLARDPFRSRNYKGSISNTMIYNRALSAQEIQQNYNAQKSRFNL